MHRERALVTGASSGIGLQMAKLLAAEGVDLILLARSQQAMDTMAAELEGRYGIDSRVLAVDLARDTAATEVAEWLESQRLEVDLLINNAGFGALGSVLELPIDRQLEMIRLNVSALTHLTHLLLPGMIARRRGGVLNVASTAAFAPGPKMAVYYATKAFVLSFSEALAEELTGSGVTISCLCPGPTATGFGAVAGMEGSRLFRLGTMDAKSVARAGIEGFRRGKPVVVPGWRNKLTAFSVRLTPRRVVRKVVRLLQS